MTIECPQTTNLNLIIEILWPQQYDWQRNMMFREYWRFMPRLFWKHLSLLKKQFLMRNYSGSAFRE